MRRLLLVGVLGCTLASPTAAWNGRGHMIVAAKAWENLTPETKRAVKSLLRHNPRYASWTAGVPAASKGRAAFIRASTWPDFIKSARGYTNDGLPSAVAARNIGYADCLQHRYWHFQDLPFSPDGTATAEPPTPNAETQIELFTEALSDSATSDEIKSYDLAWLIHLVGDVHQPLHATQRFVSSDTNGDRGGNDVTFCLSSPCHSGRPLHSFWDGAFGGSEDLSSVITFARGMATPPATQADELSPATWLQESFDAAKAQAYQPPIDNTLGPVVLTSTYRNQTAVTATQRASLAGVRLAKLLNGMNLRTHVSPVVSHRCPNGT